MQISDIFLNCVYSDVVSNRTLETHDAFEIGYIKKGQAAVNISGRNYLAGAGTLTIISKYEEHEFRVLSDEYGCVYPPGRISISAADRGIPQAGKVFA